MSLLNDYKTVEGIISLFPMILVFDETANEGEEVLAMFYTRITGTVILPLVAKPLQAKQFIKDNDPTVLGVLQKLLDIRGMIKGMQGTLKNAAGEKMKSAAVYMPFEIFREGGSAAYCSRLAISVHDNVAVICTDTTILYTSLHNLEIFSTENAPAPIRGKPPVNKSQPNGPEMLFAMENICASNTLLV